MDIHPPSFQNKLELITDWLIREANRAVESYKEFLPKKAKRDTEPQLVWMTPPTHMYFGNKENFNRKLQADVIQQIAQTKKNNTSLKMLKEWHYDISQLFIKDANRFTSIGMDKYWMSIDSAIRFWSVAITPKMGSVKNFVKKKDFNHAKHFNMFHWKKPYYKKNRYY